MAPLAMIGARLPVLPGTGRNLSTDSLAKPPGVDEPHIPCFPSQRIVQFFPRAVFVVACKLTQCSVSRACGQLGESYYIPALVAHKHALHLLLPEWRVHVRQGHWTPKPQGRPLQNQFPVVPLHTIELLSPRVFFRQVSRSQGSAAAKGSGPDCRSASSSDDSSVPNPGGAARLCRSRLADRDGASSLFPKLRSKSHVYIVATSCALSCAKCMASFIWILPNISLHKHTCSPETCTMNAMTRRFDSAKPPSVSSSLGNFGVIANKICLITLALGSLHHVPHIFLDLLDDKIFRLQKSFPL